MPDVMPNTNNPQNNKPVTGAEQFVSGLIKRLTDSDCPQGLKEKTIERLNQLAVFANSPAFLPEIDRMNKYVDWIVSYPWNKKTKDILDLKRAREVFEKHHYGLQDLKERIMEHMSVMQLTLQRQAEAETQSPVLCFVGLVGTGKTTMAIAIADALGRKLARIPFGGMGDPLDLRGQSRMHPEAEPGKMIKALVNAQSRNPVVLLDEIDRVTDEGRASIMGVLVELLDPNQNNAFVDHYMDFPVDLSECIFIATANNTTGIATAVMDRLEPIVMPSYNDQEKIAIAKKYIIPKELEKAAIPDGTIEISENVWINIVRPLGFDAGIRTLQRTIRGLVRKVAKQIIEGKGEKFVINEENVKHYLPPQ